MDDEMNEYLPKIRCTAGMKRALSEIAEASVSANLSDHIRRAVQQYIERENAKGMSIEDYEHLVPSEQLPLPNMPDYQ